MKRVVFLLFILSSSLFAVERYALVIGNSSYNSAPLKNTVNDAIDISDRFISMGYKVKMVLDGNKEDIERSIINLRSSISDSAMVVFYYAGHAVQIEGDNFLIPVGEIIESEADIRYRGVEFSWIVNSLKESSSRTNVYILDACRDNPYASSTRGGSRGLKVVSAPPNNSAEIKNSAIIYATSEGNIADDGDGRNSPFTSALLKHMGREGETILDVMTYVTQEVFLVTGGRQEPTMTNALKEKVYFGKKGQSNNSVIQVLPAPELSLQQEILLEEKDQLVSLRTDLLDEINQTELTLNNHYKNLDKRNSDNRIKGNSGLTAFFSYLGTAGLGYLSYRSYTENYHSEITKGLVISTGAALLTGIIANVISNTYNTRVKDFDYREYLLKDQKRSSERELKEVDRDLEKLNKRLSQS